MNPNWTERDLAESRASHPIRALDIALGIAAAVAVIVGLVIALKDKL